VASAHGGEEYERLVHGGELALQLHAFEVEHHHGRIGDPAARPDGSGLALWFQIDGFDGRRVALAGSARMRTRPPP